MPILRARTNRFHKYPNNQLALTMNTRLTWLKISWIKGQWFRDQGLILRISTANNRSSRSRFRSPVRKWILILGSILNSYREGENKNKIMITMPMLPSRWVSPFLLGRTSSKILKLLIKMDLQILRSLIKNKLAWQIKLEPTNTKRKV